MAQAPSLFFYLVDQFLDDGKQKDIDGLLLRRRLKVAPQCIMSVGVDDAKWTIFGIFGDETRTMVGGKEAMAHGTGVTVGGTGVRRGAGFSVTGAISPFGKVMSFSVQSSAVKTNAAQDLLVPFRNVH